jgi:hypothetical protein
MVLEARLRAVDRGMRTNLGIASPPDGLRTRQCDRGNVIREVSERSSSLAAAKVAAKFGKAGAKFIDDMDVLLVFYAFPAGYARRSRSVST